jgi:hypothetical protein
VASGNTLYWVLLLVYVGASGDTLYWVLLWVYLGLHLVLLLVYEGPRDKHLTGYCCGLCEASGNTPYWTSLGLMWAVFINAFQNNIFKIIQVEKSKYLFPHQSSKTRKIEVSVSVSILQNC